MEAGGVDAWIPEDIQSGQETLSNDGASNFETFSSLELQGLSDSNAVKGVCGLNNLGNTCFMNSGLQCLLSNSSIIKYFLEDQKQEDTFMESLTGKFAELLTKIWQGKYSTLDPSAFKEFLGIYHPQFKDYRQHDCQEFLALLLDSLHEQLNKAPAKQMSADSENQDGPGCCSQLSPPASVEVHTEAGAGDAAASCAQAAAEMCAKKDMDCTHCMSDDSNQSLLSDNSSTLTDDMNALRTASIPENMKQYPVVTTGGDITEKENTPTQDENSFNFDIFKCEAASSSLPFCGDRGSGKVNSFSLPEIEEFYMKDSKTLNTNVLVTEFDHEIVTTDSDKFLKQDNTLREPDPLENLGETFIGDDKSHSPKGIKDTNLLANVKAKFSEVDGSDKITKCLFRDQEDNCMQENHCNINNIKRMKTDEDQKNVRLQAKRKVNMARNQTADDGAHSSSNLAMNNQTVELSDSAPGLQPWSRALESREAELAWRRYLFRNESIIVDQFQGQFKSTVICANCQHVSVTYEPFMYLSVPLPHALERQISVMFVPSDSKPTVCHLITLNKRDAVSSLRGKLLAQIGDESCDIILAEVFDNHIARILDNSTMLRFVDDINRAVYAFEMIPPTQAEEPDSDDEANEAESSCQHSNNEEQTFLLNADQPRDIFSSVGFFSPNAAPQGETNSTKPKMNKSDWKSAENAVLNNFEAGDSAWPLPLSVDSGMVWNETDLFSETKVDVSGTGIWVEDTSLPKASWVESPMGEPGTPDRYSVENTCNSQLESPGSGSKKVDNVNQVSSDGWRSCVICLEEKLDSDMRIHASCGGVLCQSCLEMSFKHYGEAAFVCPVCSVPVNPVEEFTAVLSCGETKRKTRILSMPVIYRFDHVVDGQMTKRLFGHPCMVYVQSSMSGESLYDAVDRVVPLTASYTILLTDGQGYHCSRCMYTNHCSGCELNRDGEVSLQPGDHLTVRFENLTQQQMESAGSFIDHPSMENLRSKDPLTLFDCLSAFTDSEILDEHNPWYCPHCRRNQCANKTMTVWQYPQTLIIQLKRFVFHDLSSSKLDNKVVFPTEDLDLSNFISGPENSDLVYDLQSCVCHFGGVNTGHYTSYAKHPISRKWYYYNDETVCDKEPHDDIFSSAYVLFFQKQGTQVDLKMLDDCAPHLAETRTFDQQHDSSTLQNDQDQDDMTEILKSLNNVTN